MFIKLFAAIYQPETKTFDEASFVYLDATAIHTIADLGQGDVEEVGCAFVMVDELYRCETFTAEALVELVIEARLHPAQCLPNVGKPKDESRVGERLRLNADEK